MSVSKHDIPEPVFISSPKAATLCGVSRNTICGWIRNGKLPSYRTPGGKYLLRPDELMEFMASNGMYVPPGLEQLAKAEATPKTEVPPNEPAILVVDDEPDMRRMLTATLQSLGLPILQAENGFDALHNLTVHPNIALVIMDMMMPGQGGATTFDIIHKDSPSLPVIVVTGLDPDDAASRFTDAKPDFILSKPFSAGHLREICTTYLNDLGF